MDGLDCLDQVTGGHILQEVAQRARLDGGENPLILAKAGQDDNLGAGAGRPYSSGSLDSIHLWHCQVHEDYVGPGLAGQIYCLQAVGGLPHDLDVVMELQQGPQTLAYRPMVVSYQDSNLINNFRNLDENTFPCWTRKDVNLAIGTTAIPLLSMGTVGN